MNRYWLAQNGETTGPFAEEVLLNMWQHGKIQIDAQVCLEGMEDWMDAKFLINEMETLKERKLQSEQQRQAHSEQRAKQARKTMREKEKSGMMAFILSWLFPGLGHLYCGYAGEALLLAVLGIGFVVLDFSTVGFFLFSPLILILISCAAFAAAKRRNTQTADELGL